MLNLNPSEGYRTISMIKGRQRFVFRYAVGREEDMANEFKRLAENPFSGIDWVDAAVLSYQVGRLDDYLEFLGRANNRTE